MTTFSHDLSILDRAAPMFVSAVIVDFKKGDDEGKYAASIYIAQSNSVPLKLEYPDFETAVDARADILRLGNACAVVEQEVFWAICKAFKQFEKQTTVLR